MALPLIKKNSPIPIMSDESCSDHNDAKRLIDLNACDYLNIKIGKSSGILKAQKIIKVAEENNVKLQIGGFLESRLGFTASAHLALLSKNIVFYDFDTPLMFNEDNVADGIVYEKNGKINLPDKIGLGASIQGKYLRKMESVKVKK